MYFVEEEIPVEKEFVSVEAWVSRLEYLNKSHLIES
jgi:hypothetical protein